MREAGAGVGNMSLFVVDIEIYFEDIFTIGTKRDVNFTRQRFTRVARPDLAFEQQGPTEMGKQSRTNYGLARLGCVL